MNIEIDWAAGIPTNKFNRQKDRDIAEQKAYEKAEEWVETYDVPYSEAEYEELQDTVERHAGIQGEAVATIWFKRGGNRFRWMEELEMVS